jgi:hypothetical protein
MRPTPKNFASSSSAAALEAPWGHGKRMSHLIAGLVADSPGPVRLTDEADGKAPFSIYKTDDPAVKLDQPFLLIARTVQIVTARTH